MTREEIIKKIDEIETRKFYLAMKDHWSREDFETNDKMFNELLKLRKKLKNM